MGRSELPNIAEEPGFRERMQAKDPLKSFDPASAYAAGRKAFEQIFRSPLPTPSAIRDSLANRAGAIRERLDRGERVVITAGGKRLSPCSSRRAGPCSPPVCVGTTPPRAASPTIWSMRLDPSSRTLTGRPCGSPSRARCSQKAISNHQESIRMRSTVIDKTGVAMAGPDTPGLVAAEAREGNDVLVHETRLVGASAGAVSRDQAGILPMRGIEVTPEMIMAASRRACATRTPWARARYAPC